MAQCAAVAVRFTGHWQELLWDLAYLGPIWIETSATGVTLRQSVALHCTPFIRLATPHFRNINIIIEAMRSAIECAVSAQ